MAAPSQESEPLRDWGRKLTPKMRDVMKRVGAKSYPAYSTDRTVRSLERIGVVEHTSIGWRLTDSGIRWLRHIP